MPQITDPWRVLGVDHNADKESIKEAYRKLVKKYHPDRYTDPNAKELAEEKMAEINQAYDAITSGKADASYHSSGSSPGGYSSSGTGGYSGGSNGYPGGNPFEEWFREQQNQQNWNRQQQGSPYYRESRGGGCCDPNTLACLCCLNSCCNILGGGNNSCC